MPVGTVIIEGGGFFFFSNKIYSTLWDNKTIRPYAHDKPVCMELYGSAWSAYSTILYYRAVGTPCAAVRCISETSVMQHVRIMAQLIFL